MLLVKATNNTIQQYPYSIGLLRKDNPNTSFPKKVSTADLAAFNAYPVTEVTPTVTATQKLVKTWTPTLVGGEWVLAHAAVDLTVEETTAATDVLATAAREKRDKLLRATDWVVIRATASMRTGTGEHDVRNMMSFGEAADNNLMGGAKKFPVAMAEKRAMSRVVLKIAGFYEQGVFGQDEMAD